MAIAMLGAADFYHVTVGGVLIIGDVGAVPRLQPPAHPEAQDITLGPVTGQIAVVEPLVPQLIVTRSTAVDPAGYTVTLVVQNNPAPIFYTLDGSPVTQAKTRYIGPIRITGTPGQSITLKYKAFALAQSGYSDSVEVSVILILPTPIDLDIGVINTDDDLVKDITITPTPLGTMTIRYTLDGTVPSMTHGSTYTGLFQVSGTAGGSVTIKAAAFPSESLSESYYLLQSDLEVVTVTF